MLTVSALYACFWNIDGLHFRSVRWHSWQGWPHGCGRWRQEKLFFFITPSHAEPIDCVHHRQEGWDIERWPWSPRNRTARCSEKRNQGEHFMHGPLCCWTRFSCGMCHAACCRYGSSWYFVATRLKSCWEKVHNIEENLAPLDENKLVDACTET